MGTREVVLAAVVPAVVSVVVLLIAHFVVGKSKAGSEGGSAEDRGSGGDRRGPATLGPVVLGALFVVLLGGGVVLGSYAWQSEVSLWKESVTHRGPAVALVAAVLGLIGVLTPVRRSAVGLGVLGLVGGWFAGWAVLSGLHASLIGEAERWAWVGGVGLIAGVQAWAMARGARVLPGWRGPALVWLVVGVAALGATAGLANAPQLLWPIAGSAFALGIVGLVRRDVDLLAGATPAVAVVLMGVVSMSHWFGSEERWVMFGLLSAGPAGIGVAALLGGKPAWVRLVVAGAVSLGLVGAQAGMSVPALIDASTDSGGDGYYDY